VRPRTRRNERNDVCCGGGMRWPLVVVVSGHGMLYIGDRRSPEKAFLCALKYGHLPCRSSPIKNYSDVDYWALSSKEFQRYSLRSLVREPATSFHTNCTPITISPVLRQVASCTILLSIATTWRQKQTVCNDNHPDLLMHKSIATCPMCLASEIFINFPGPSAPSRVCAQAVH
jgi:hypothetical protein